MLDKALSAVILFLKNNHVQFVQQGCCVCKAPTKATKVKRYYIHIGCIDKGFSLFYGYEKCRVDVVDRSQHDPIRWPNRPREPTPPGWKHITMYLDETKFIVGNNTRFKSVCSTHSLYPRLPFQLTLNVCPNCALELVVNITLATPTIKTVYGPIFVMNGIGHFIMKDNSCEERLNMIEVENQLDIGLLRLWSKSDKGYILERGQLGAEHCNRCSVLPHKIPVNPDTPLPDILPLPEFSLFADLDDVFICWGCTRPTNDYKVAKLPRCRGMHHSNIGMAVPLCPLCRRQCWQCGINPTLAFSKTTCFECGSEASMLSTSDFSGPMVCPDLHPTGKLALPSS